MRKLHSFILKSYVMPFLVTFFVALVLLVMQFLWKYIDDLMGKGLEFTVILELLFYASANLIPMALPLAILLSSIMTFGKLGEDNELVAMKSSGLSLFKIMRPLIVLMIMMSMGAFYFSNYLWPAANLKMRVLITDIQQKRPAFSIKEGVPYDEIDGYIITIEEKDDKNNTFKQILISDQSEDKVAVRREIYADHGSMQRTEDGQYLILTLFDGYIDEELDRKNIENSKQPYQQTEFERARMKFDLSALEFDRTNVENYREAFEMYTLKQINYTLDSLKGQIEKEKIKRMNLIGNKLFLRRDSLAVSFDTVPEKSMMASLNPHELNHAYDIAISNLRSSKEILKNPNVQSRMDAFKYYITHLEIAFNRKFTLSYACILLFFIGAPLGAIIKRGGFGMPVVASVIFFILYYMLSISGEKMAKTEVMDPYWGMWFSSLILTPIAIFLTYKAANDSALFDVDAYLRFFKLKKRSN